MVIISRDGIEEEVEGGGEMVQLENIPPEPDSPTCDFLVLFDGVPEIDSDSKQCNATEDVKDAMWNSLFAAFLQVNMTTKIRQMPGNLEIIKELDNKEEAEKTKTGLVHVFDYAWNTGGNDVRRPNDTPLKLDKINSSTSLFPNVTRKLQQWLLVLEQPFIGKKSGVQIELVSPVKSDGSNDQTMEVPHSRDFKFGRTQPRLVIDKCFMNKEDAVICGVCLGDDGSVCKVKPVRGRKRCQEHKWKRVSESVKEDKSVICGVILKDGFCCIQVPVQGRERCELHKGMRISSSARNVQGKGSNSNTISDRKSENEESCTIICGILLRDGSVCNVKPIQGRRRCGEHKEQRVTRSISLQDDSTWDEHFGRGLSLVFDESQTTAVLGSTSIAVCNHKSSIKLIWGSHGTGNAKTLRILLCTKSCRPFACAQTNVRKLVIDFYHMDPGQDNLLRSLGDLLLFGSRKRLEVCDDLEEIYSARVVKPDQWKSVSRVLTNASNWENYLLCKEGIESYRNHNLPLTCSCPGLYDLGVTSTWTNVDSDVRKLEPNRKITVYPGQADNNRVRLQDYCWAGSRLDLGESTNYPNADINFVYQLEPRLFREIVSKGSPIVLKCTSLENKEEAKRTETQLVSIFDYAWNTGGNASTSLFPNVTRELKQLFFGRLRQIQQWLLALEQSFIGKKSGVQIELVSPTKSDSSNDQTNDDSCSRVSKFGRTQPLLVFDKCDMHKEDAVVCGVSLGDGSVCKVKPVRGRKRCQEHKWKRIIGRVPESVKEDKSVVCGVNLKDGSCCVEVPVQGRKRCALHKGMRISSAARNVHGKASNSNAISDRRSENEENCTIICGILLSDGSVCNVRPMEGRKRCGEHKGRRVARSISKSKTEETSVICGVGLEDGSLCMENPVKGRKRCEMHKGKRIKPKVS